MKEKKYKESYKFHTVFDTTNGREKQVATYVGSYYSLSSAHDRFFPFSFFLLLFTFLCWVCFLAFLFANTESARCLYVLLPLACGTFPLFYLIMGFFGFFRAPKVMTIVRKEKGIGRIFHSFIGVFILFTVSLIGDIVFTISHNLFNKEWVGLILLLSACISSFFGFLHSKKIYLSCYQIEKEPESSTESNLDA